MKLLAVSVNSPLRYEIIRLTYRPVEIGLSSVPQLESAYDLNPFASCITNEDFWGHDMEKLPSLIVREIEQTDYDGWKPLWDGYNAFYGREGPTALPEKITQTTWQRFFDSKEPIFALVAVTDGALTGIAHYLYHRNTIRLELSCYMQDLYTLPKSRGQGIGRALVQGVYERARADGIGRVYWHTKESNAAGRLLYDKVAKHAGFIVYAHEL